VPARDGAREPEGKTLAEQDATTLHTATCWQEVATGHTVSAVENSQVHPTIMQPNYCAQIGACENMLA
jgi:hypothetical protein